VTHSESISELATALAEARKSFAPFGKGHTAKVTSVKGSYEYKYGDLADLFDATTPALSAQGLTISQWPDLDDDGRFVLVTWLLHKSGQWMRGRYPLNTYERPQEQGSALTYAKRYAAGAVLGISSEADDDGAAAQKAEPSKPVAVPSVPPGFQDWFTDLLAVADEGTDALQKAWKASPVTMRDHLTKHASKEWDAIKAKAAKVKQAVPA
jgi:hypothetical protein